MVEGKGWRVEGEEEQCLFSLHPPPFTRYHSRGRTMQRALIAALALLAFCPAAPAQAPKRPNILWITCEDIGPHLGCYGDAYARTPNLDKLAKKSVLYRHAWSNAPVCTPARTTIITGLYPTSTGAEHMRSMTRLPAALWM